MPRLGVAARISVSDFGAIGADPESRGSVVVAAVLAFGGVGEGSGLLIACSTVRIEVIVARAVYRDLRVW